MKQADRELNSQAAAALRIRDVMLNRCSFNRPTPPPDNTETTQVQQFIKQTVQYVIGDAQESDGRNIKLLQVTVGLGIRITGMEPEGTPVYFEIEADFLVEYEMVAEVSEAAIKTFADHNSVHNVWPFWRQHVFDIVSRGRLPHLDIPLYSISLAKLESGQDAESAVDNIGAGKQS
jgi:preprotein translocase subunit SecB